MINSPGIRSKVNSVRETLFVVGGCRSGKSRQALETAEAIAKDRKIFIATCIPHDAEMKQRVERHQKERSWSWQTVEAPIHLPRKIVECSRQANVLVADCLTLWISNLMLESEDDDKILKHINSLTQALESPACPIVIVSNEVGTGIVPENNLSRRFRDLVGAANQAVAAQADKVIWMVAGIAVKIKG